MMYRIFLRTSYFYAKCIAISQSNARSRHKAEPARSTKQGVRFRTLPLHRQISEPAPSPSYSAARQAAIPSYKNSSEKTTVAHSRSA